MCEVLFVDTNKCELEIFLCEFLMISMSLTSDRFIC